MGMPETELPDGGCLMFQRNGEQVPDAPAACVRGSLATTLDAEGRPIPYEPTEG
jgi:branched-chain amino acid transport system substrate-binding protein